MAKKIDTTTKNVLSASVIKVLSKKLPHSVLDFVEAWYGQVVRAVEKKIAHGYRDSMGCAQAADVAREATEYAIGALANCRGGVPTVDGWVALALTKARFLANSHHRQKRAGRVAELLVDAPMSEAEADGGCAEAYCVTQASYQDWVVREQVRAREARASFLYEKLDDLLRTCGVTRRAGAIFKAYHLEDQPIETVARLFDATRNDIYVTTSRVLRKLRQFGPGAAAAAFALAA